MGSTMWLEGPAVIHFVSMTRGLMISRSGRRGSNIITRISTGRAAKEAGGGLELADDGRNRWKRSFIDMTGAGFPLDIIVADLEEIEDNDVIF